MGRIVEFDLGEEIPRGAKFLCTKSVPDHANAKLKKELIPGDFWGYRSAFEYSYYETPVKVVFCYEIGDDDEKA